MKTDRKKPGVAFWATVVVVCLPLLYVLSVGPACWVATHTDLFGNGDLPVIYRPIGWLCYHSEVAEKVIFAYARLWMKRNESVDVQTRDGYWMGI